MFSIYALRFLSYFTDIPFIPHGIPVVVIRIQVPSGEGAGFYGEHAVESRGPHVSTRE